MGSEYAAAGVDYRLVDPFKREMQEVNRKTREFPFRRGVIVSETKYLRSSSTSYGRTSKHSRLHHRASRCASVPVNER